jgi:hypothetical protein
MGSGILSTVSSAEDFPPPAFSLEQVLFFGTSKTILPIREHSVKVDLSTL